MKTFKEYFGKKAVEDIKKRLDAFLESEEGGFIIIGDFKNHKVTDAYYKVCKHCVVNTVEEVVEDADENGLLSKCTN